MSVNVRVPTILRTYTGGESEVSAEGATVADVLESLDANYQGIKGRIVDGLATEVNDGSEVSVIPAVAGG